uniref:Galectin n=1 Tax=Anopheles melas TaxID=34690 RepID=A0A182TFE0_9DIPT
MSNRPFTAKFPRYPENGDEVFIRGKLKDDAKRPAQVAEHQTPPYIALHFKTIYDEKNDTSRVVLNWKNLQWQQEEVLDNYWHVDRSQTFRVVFRLHEDCIKVFVNSVDHPPDYQFPVQLPLDQIESIELWDDVEHVEEISFRYDNGNSPLDFEHASSPARFAFVWNINFVMGGAI